MPASALPSRQTLARERAEGEKRLAEARAGAETAIKLQLEAEEAGTRARTELGKARSRVQRLEVRGAGVRPRGLRPVEYVEEGGGAAQGVTWCCATTTGTRAAGAGAGAGAHDQGAAERGGMGPTVAALLPVLWG